MLACMSDLFNDLEDVEETEDRESTIHLKMPMDM